MGARIVLITRHNETSHNLTSITISTTSNCTLCCRASLSSPDICSEVRLVSDSTYTPRACLKSQIKHETLFSYLRNTHDDYQKLRSGTGTPCLHLQEKINKWGYCKEKNRRFFLRPGFDKSCMTSADCGSGLQCRKIPNAECEMQVL